VFIGSRSNQQICTPEGVEGDELIVAGVANEVAACVQKVRGGMIKSPRWTPQLVYERSTHC